MSENTILVLNYILNIAQDILITKIICFFLFDVQLPECSVFTIIPTFITG